MTVNKVLVIGAGVAGMQACLELAAAGLETWLVEKDSALGGHVRKYATLFPVLIDGRSLTAAKSGRIRNNSLIKVQTSAEITEINHIDSGFSAELKTSTGTIKENFGAVVMATGFEIFDARKYGEYGYGRYPGVVTSIDFEEQGYELLRKPLATVVFVQCVGARDRSKGMPYCSKVCCLYTAKQAMEVKKAKPSARVYVLYMDVRANVNGGEEFYRGVMENERVNYIRGRVSKIYPDGTKLIIRTEDTLMGSPLEIAADLVVLASAMTSNPATADFVSKLGGNVDDYGFISPASLSDCSNPMTIAPGVFYAGACGFPVDTRDAIAQGSAAAAGVIGYLQSSPGRKERM